MFMNFLNWTVKKIHILKEKYQWIKFQKTHPNLTEYLKPYQSPKELANKLVSQGLIIPNRNHCEDVIFSHNYYRLKAYFIPFQNSNKQFSTGVTFNDVLELYEADQLIRDFIFPIIAKIEIRIRATLDNVMTSETMDPFWHLDPSNFIKWEDVEKAVSKAESRFSLGLQEFSSHYTSKYYTKKSFKYKKTPPFWIISEIFTLEQLNSVVKNIDKEKFRTAGGNKLAKCAKKFGFTSHDSLITNLKCLLQLRNICAHHSRLWNKNLQAPNGIKRNMSIKTQTTAKPNRLYENIVMLRIMCKSQNINDDLKTFFMALISSNSLLQRDMHSMGFPPAWDTDNVWK